MLINIVLTTALQFGVCISEDGKLYTFGENEMGKLGLGDDRVDVSSNTPQHVDSIEEPVKCVSCGNSHTAAITGK